MTFLIHLDRFGTRQDTGHILIKEGLTVHTRQSFCHMKGCKIINRSREVCITNTEGKVTLRDAGTTNGTFVNGVRIPTETDVPVVNRDVITFGGPVRFRENDEIKYNEFIYAFMDSFPDPSEDCRDGNSLKRKRGPGLSDDGASADALTCGICFEIFAKPRVLDCSHAFCLACIDKALRSGNKSKPFGCPTCRAQPEGRFVGRCIPLEQAVACHAGKELSKGEREALVQREEEGDALLERLANPTEVYDRILASVTRG